MKIFGKERDSLKIKAVRAVRAKYAIEAGTEEVEVHLKTSEGHRLDLQFSIRDIPNLIGELTDAYEAINPPLSRRNNAAASWDGSGT